MEVDRSRFVGKVVVSTETKRRFVLTTITAVEMTARAENLNERGVYDTYSWNTVNGDPVSRGQLVFEDTSLTEAFIKAFETYCNSAEGRWERYEYFFFAWD